MVLQLSYYILAYLLIYMLMKLAFCYTLELFNAECLLLDVKYLYAYSIAH